MAPRPRAHWGRAAAIEAAGAASQIPADCNPEVYGEGFWSRVNARAGRARPYRTDPRTPRTPSVASRPRTPRPWSPGGAVGLRGQAVPGRW